MNVATRNRRFAKIARPSSTNIPPIADDAGEAGGTAQAGEAQDLLLHRGVLADRGEVGGVEAGQDRDGEQLHAVAFGRLARRLQHRPAAGGVDVEEGDAEAAQRPDRARDRVRDVVQLEVEEDRWADLAHPPHALRAVRAHELEAELQATDRACERSTKGESAIEVGPVDGAEDGRGRGHGCGSLGA
jgi:hypothetical protein